ncbi:hypothetical protein HG264_02095 [Pseudomonas sp. gcc21]|uniref:hypothetical protein n=1 Tax=Pseudomonas sp. gcc21 TaxID=2726989 RepID=UPI001451F44A|nr:hypothetical protein [Pseudomonas sp. gcc21]QJD57785.1 hypothetical protein HG264_02095 [Pseudomonas sp. gcc21]
MTVSAINPAVNYLSDLEPASQVKLSSTLALASTTTIRVAVLAPTLGFLGVESPAAENLILGTLLVMSSLPQTKCPLDGIGPYAIPPALHIELWDNYLAHSPDQASLVRGLASQHCFLKNPHAELGFNLAYATAIAWAVYEYRGLTPKDPTPLTELARIWQAAYPHRNGHANDFIRAWNQTLDAPHIG